MINEQQLSRCSTVTALSLLAKRMKEQGEDPKEVNRLVSARRKELVAKVGKVNTLEKTTLSASSVPRKLVTHLSIVPEDNLTSPRIRIVNTGSGYTYYL